MLQRARVRYPDRQERRLLRPLSRAHGGNAPVGADYETVPGEAAPAGGARRGDGAGQQDRPAQARGDETLHGSADSSFQALYRRLPRSGRRGLRRGRGAQGRVRGLSDRRRHQPALQVQDPRAVLRAVAGDGFPHARAHAGRCRGNHRLARHRVRRDRPLDLAKQSQNPIADLVSEPFQSNANFNTGPFNRTQEILGLAQELPPQDGSGDEDSGANFHGQQRKNDTHASTSDPDNRLYRKAAGREGSSAIWATLPWRTGMGWRWPAGSRSPTGLPSAALRR